MKIKIDSKNKDIISTLLCLLFPVFAFLVQEQQRVAMSEHEDILHDGAVGEQDERDATMSRAEVLDPTTISGALDEMQLHLGDIANAGKVGGLLNFLICMLQLYIHPAAFKQQATDAAMTDDLSAKVPKPIRTSSFKMNDVRWAYLNALQFKFQEDIVSRFDAWQKQQQPQDVFYGFLLLISSATNRQLSPLSILDYLENYPANGYASPEDVPEEYRPADGEWSNLESTCNPAEHRRFFLRGKQPFTPPKHDKKLQTDVFAARIQRLQKFLQVMMSAYSIPQLPVNVYKELYRCLLGIMTPERVAGQALKAINGAPNPQAAALSVGALYPLCDPRDVRAFVKSLKQQYKPVLTALFQVAATGELYDDATNAINDKDTQFFLDNAPKQAAAPAQRRGGGRGSLFDSADEEGSSAPSRGIGSFRGGRGRGH